MILFLKLVKMWPIHQSLGHFHYLVGRCIFCKFWGGIAMPFCPPSPASWVKHACFRCGGSGTDPSLSESIPWSLKYIIIGELELGSYIIRETVPLDRVFRNKAPLIFCPSVTHSLTNVFLFSLYNLFLKDELTLSNKIYVRAYVKYVDAFSVCHSLGQSVKGYIKPFLYFDWALKKICMQERIYVFIF